MDSKIQKIVYEVGNPGFHGKTMINIGKDNKTDVSRQQGDKVESYSGMLTEDEAATLFQAIETADVCNIKSTKTMIEPDTAPLTIQIYYADSHCGFEGWESERFQHSGLNQAILEFNRIATKISKGKIKY